VWRDSVAHLKPKYLQEPEAGGRDRWMVSYMDVLTILLIFFVAIAAKSLERPLEKPAAAPVLAKMPAPPPPAPAPVLAKQSAPPPTAPAISPARQALVDAQSSLEQHGLDLRMEARGLVISVPQAVLFRSGADQVSSQALPIIAQVADVVRGMPNQLSLVGYADTVPIHNRHFKNNWDLSAARSLNLLAVLSHKYGIAESRLSVASYGPYRPTGSNDTVDGRAHNRRVEIVILDESAQK
jgi:chemotaxis protein MotB